MTDEPVYFYTPDGPHGLLSNFARLGVALDGAWWPTAEHYFQAQKFTDPAHRERIRRAGTAKRAADLGRTRAVPLRPDWEEARVLVMARVLEAKFRTHPAARDLLLATGGRELVESAPGDAFWGAGPEGMGENRLGRLLMDLRARLRAQAACGGPPAR